MSFLLDCPQIGKRPVSEFSFGGEYKQRPQASDNFDRWVDFVFFRRNPPGFNLEWWFHRPSELWFLVYRDSTKNTDHQSFDFDDTESYSQIIGKYVQ